MFSNIKAENKYTADYFIYENVPYENSVYFTYFKILHETAGSSPELLHVCAFVCKNVTRF